MNIIYYVELNLVCIIILMMFRGLANNRLQQLSQSGRSFDLLIWFTVILCFADMVAGICRGQLFQGARILIEISNLLYFEALVVIGYLWVRYVYISVNNTTYFSMKSIFLLRAPLIIFTIIVIINPFTDFLFSINEANFYMRGQGVIVHWIITWSYFLIATIMVAYSLIIEKNRLKRQAMIPLLSFFIAPLIASLIQMFFYGVSSTQVGITIAIVMIYLYNQNSQILTDRLTGINNRRGLDNFLNDYLGRSNNQLLTLVMIDINDFKQVNDQYGHKAGDSLLQRTAYALKEACKEVSRSPFICRYGGDEFVIALVNESNLDIEQCLKTSINKASLTIVDYKLSIGVGVAAGVCTTQSEIDSLLSLADERMYADKKELKKSKR